MIQRPSNDILWMASIACLWGMQSTMIAGQILSLWHLSSPLAAQILPDAVSRFAPKWDLILYAVFIVSSLVFGILIFIFYKGLIQWQWIVFEAILTFLMLSAVFKLVIYDQSQQLAQMALLFLTGLSILTKMFYLEIKRLGLVVLQKLERFQLGRYENALWVAAIVLLVFMPDCERVISMIFIGEDFHHFDFLISAVGWASVWHQVPYKDVIAQYGVGLPVFFGHIIHSFGGFDYVRALEVMMWFVIFYFISSYFLVRYWLGSGLIAGVAFLLIFRLQMFHYGVSPLIWSVASGSPIRFGLDVLWLGMLLAHMRTGAPLWVIGSAIYSGFAVYYMSSTGFCVMFTFYAYLLSFLLLPALRPTSKQQHIYWLCWILPIVSALFFFFLTIHGEIFKLSYWHRFIDYMEAFSQWGSIPMYESLKYRHYWAFFMSMVMPLTYLATLLYAGISLFIEKGAVERLFPILLCIYGLTNYQYYVVRAALTSYYVNALPFVLICCFWWMRGVALVPCEWKKKIQIAALVLSLYALLTNQNYLAYPNLLNPSANPMTDNLVIQRFPDRGGYFNHLFKQTKPEDKLPLNDLGSKDEDLRTEDDFKNDEELKNYFRAHFNFSQDAHLIDQLTKPGERVALLSSFEARILIQANRPPFFYHFPMITSRPMTFRTYPSDAAQVPSYWPDTFNLLEEKKPDYIFMEKVFLEAPVPASYAKRNPLITQIVNYINSHYKPEQMGQYLVAMKRR